MATACIQKVKLCTLKPLKLNIIRSTLVKFTILTPQDLNIDSERDDMTSAHIWIFLYVCAAQSRADYNPWILYNVWL